MTSTNQHIPSNNNTNFSVIISVYLHDDVDHFIESINSIFRQTLTPYEIILAVDGPISNNMERVVENFENNPIVRLVRSDENIGRGAIKHRAILSTTTEFIAIMDADDISIDSRFELQVNAFIDSEIDLVGGYISEFHNSIDDLKSVRKVPLKHEEIIKQGKWIQPYNHVTIMFKKSMYIKSGGYGKLYMVEDYDLFFHMAMSGAIFYNIPKILVYVRTTNDQYLRRHGIKYFQEEFFLMLSMLRSGYIGHWVFIKNIALRLIVRSMPVILLRTLTKSFLRSGV
jgi:glycosyltransferase involved in cell wall biosynthesis